MNTNLDRIAKDLYGKIETRFPDIKIGDEEAKVLSKKSDIPKARFFEFEYKDDGESLGTIAITLDEDDGIVVQISGDLSKSAHAPAFKFIRSFRQFAKDRLLNFDVQNIGKSQLDKRDYQFQAKPKEEPVMAPVNPVMESKMYGTARMSYQDLGEAKLIVKHSQPVNPNVAAARTMHIEGIWVENADGERFKYPYKHLNGARALAEHLKHGGNPYDNIGKHITSLSEELAQLRKFKGYVSRNEALSEAMNDITPKVFERIEEVKKEIHNLQRPSYYAQFSESFEAREEQMIPEEIMSDWIDRLTVRTFNEELKTAFPYIFRLVDESEIPVKELSPDDLLAEKSTSEKQARFMAAAAHDPAFAKKVGMKQSVAKEFNKADTGTKQLSNAMKHKKNRKTEESYLEAFLNNIVNEDEEDQEGENELFSKDVAKQSAALDKLKSLLAGDLKPGVDGVNAALSLKGIIDSQVFADDYLKGLSDNDDVGTILKKYLQDLATGKIDDPSIEGPGLGKIKTIAQDIVATKALDGESEEPVGGEALPPAAPPAPDATAGAVPPEAPPAPDATAGAVPPAAPPAELPPTPVAESSEEEPPFDGPYTKAKGDITDKGGATHTSHSKAKHLAKTGLIRAIHNAKKAGAGLDTTLDFGHREMTLHDCIEECGMSPKDFGFDTSANESGVEQMLKSVAGFWNKEAKNFTIGGTRAKTKVLKDFKNGEFTNATEEDLHHVLKMIDKMDPSSNANGELGHIRHLAGMHNQTTDEGTEEDDFSKMFAQFKQQHPQADMTKLMQTVGGQQGQSGMQMPQMPGMGGAGMPDMNKMMGGIKMPQMPTMPQGGGNSITVNGKPATQAEFDAFTKQHNVVPGQMPGGQKLTPGQMPSLPGGMKTPQLGGSPQDMVNNMMKGMNENAELTAMLKIAGLR